MAALALGLLRRRLSCSVSSAVLSSLVVTVMRRVPWLAGKVSVVSVKGGVVCRSGGGGGVGGVG